MAHRTETQARIPLGLWDSFQEICFRFDNKFIEDVSRILGVSSVDIRRKVLGVRGAPTTVITVSGPWWEGQTCAMMVAGPAGLWHRCGHLAEGGDTCWRHRSGRGRRHDDSYFARLKKRHPFKLEGRLVWVAEDGSVTTDGGVPLKGVTINLRNGVARYTEEAELEAEPAPEKGAGAAGKAAEEAETETT
jgi:hypothetical protein